MKKLGKATGARSVTNLDDLTAKELGRADLVEERKVGTDDMTFVTGCKNARAVSILIHGGTEHVVDEVERILHDALRVVSAAIEDGKAIPGGGSAEIELSLALQSYAASVGGREQLAIEAFAGALEVIPRALGENAGLDPIDVLIKLRAAHGKKGGKAMGVDVTSGEPLDMLKANVVEPSRDADDSTISVHSEPPSAPAGCRVTSIRNRAWTPSAVTTRGGWSDRDFTMSTRGVRPDASNASRTAFTASSTDRRE